jgi:hypothetical protein
MMKKHRKLIGTTVANQYAVICIGYIFTFQATGEKEEQQ